MRIISFNVNGLRAILKKGFLSFIESSKADIYCLQEIKINSEKDAFQIKDYFSYFAFAEKKGYSGVAVYSKIEPLSVSTLGIEEFDKEGRTLILEYDNFFLFNCYFPNAQDSLRRIDYKVAYNMAVLKKAEELRKKKHIVITGDFNVAHKEIDLKNPKQNEGNAGFSKPEREFFDLLLSKGYVDTFRHFNKEPGNYTWWSYRTRARERNAGWRIDYFVVNKEFMPFVKNSRILSDVYGSDHCPIELELE